MKPCIAFFGLVLLAAAGLSSCSEKKAAPPPSTKKAESKNDGACDGSSGLQATDGCPGTADGKDGGTSDGGEDSGSFDLCGDGLEKAKISGFDTYVSELCSGDHKLVSLRKPENVYTGSDAKILKSSQKSGTETVMRLYTSALYDAAADDYWALIKLQFTKPEIFKTNYSYDHDASMDVEQATAKAATYRYKNDSGEGGVVDYQAKTDFIEIKSGQTYVAATVETKKFETMKSLKGLIIVNKNAAGKTEVLTMSDQTYEHGSGEADATESRAINALKNEQKRAWDNAKKADKAPGLLGAD